MNSSDTVELLKQCNSGSKMTVNALDEVLPMVDSAKMRDLLRDNKAHHAELGNKLHDLIEAEGAREEDPPLMAKVMSDVSIGAKLIMHPNDKEIASILTDGCNMGIKSVNEYLNKYEGASSQAKNISGELIDLEQQLMGDLTQYL